MYVDYQVQFWIYLFWFYQFLTLINFKKTGKFCTKLNFVISAKNNQRQILTSFRLTSCGGDDNIRCQISAAIMQIYLFICHYIQWRAQPQQTLKEMKHSI